MTLDLDSLGRHDNWEQVRAVVAGMGVSGFAAADNLTHIGASVIGLDEAVTDARREQATLLEILGADIRLGAGMTAQLPADADVLVTSPGWHPDAPLLAQARARGIPIWGEVELAWRLRDPEHPAPWLAVTGTNGKTTTVQMLEAMLRAAGLRTVAAGNVGLPLVEVVMDPEPYDVIAVELSSFQLHYTSSVHTESAAVLNIAEDHLDWYPDMDAYAADKGRIYSGVERACVYNVSDQRTEQLVRDADVAEGARAIGFTLGTPDVGMLGVVDDILCDRAFVEDRRTSAAEICTVADLASPAPHFVANALAAAALARSHGVPPVAIREALRSFHPDGHRIAPIETNDGLIWIDDSKATNPHAALASLGAYEHVVWIAGGLAKGASFDDLARRAADRLRAVVLIGRDAPVIEEALRRHAPDVPVFHLEVGETAGVDRPSDAALARLLDDVVATAGQQARPGDTVLLAPGCASMDLFANYASRGDAFSAAVRRRRS